MERASQCIEDLANNVLGRYPLLDVSLLLAWMFRMNPSFASIQLPGSFPASGLQLVAAYMLSLDVLVKIWKLSWSQSQRGFHFKKWMNFL